MRVQEGELVRFDSVSELVDECRARFATMHVRTATRGAEFLLYVKLPDGGRFESLIVHFEGEGCYAVMLPTAAPPRSPTSPRNPTPSRRAADADTVRLPTMSEVAPCADQAAPMAAPGPLLRPPPVTELSWPARLRRWWDRRRPAIP